MDERNRDTQKCTSDDRSFHYADYSIKIFYFVPKSENNKTQQYSLRDFNQAKSISDGWQKAWKASQTGLWLDQLYCEILPAFHENGIL